MQSDRERADAILDWCNFHEPYEGQRAALMEKFAAIRKECADMLREVALIQPGDADLLEELAERMEQGNE